MKDFIYKYTSIAAKLLLRDTIISKPISGFNKQLYYQKLQHLTFFLSKKIVYEINVWNNIVPYISKGDLIYDIGANIGQYTLRFSELVGTEGKIICFEPDYKNYSFLLFNVNINCCTNIECKKIGLGSATENSEFFRDTLTGGRASSFIKEQSLNNYPSKEIVSIETFDTMVKSFGLPDFVKIDVEGFEVEVLKGINNILKGTKFLVEVRKDTKNKVFEFFNKQSFTCFLVDNEKPIVLTNNKDIPDFSNLLFIYNGV